MSAREVRVPEEVRQKAMALGDQGQKWLDRLGCMLDELERDWNVVVGGTLNGGSGSYVAAAKASSGEDVIVKLEMPPYESYAGEVRTLAVAGGHGYARLLSHDKERYAMLQERLGPSLEETELPVPTQIEILCATLRRAWEVPPPASLQSGAEKARWLSGFITEVWEKLDQPCSQGVVE